MGNVDKHATSLSCQEIALEGLEQVDGGYRLPLLEEGEAKN